ncbi:hypothetical protein DFJ58DRAFT_719299 [Suillus subalutaceus]|uniref:uncharacterized protein n=1 Tax=Suillus subalutaceus TaxID=48586 RepID=UPI001B87A0BE|nr:uncharacterized protein DFJ58DRAFT_719299 [Suillus subalutaceus]KAG1835017.1 hypothetical protein DFJ58DRAFT_719299 [Suillus subalutaceus]
MSKWTTINQTMHDQKIGILCVHKTHLTNEHAKQIDSLFSHRLRVLNTSDPLCPAIMSLNWHNKTIKFLNIYAPNNAHEHPDFWNKVRMEWLKSNISDIDFMLGDFNLTENPIDRAPARLDNEPTINALRELRSEIKVHDTWQNENPHHQLFMFSSNQHTLSRLDRIYTSERHLESMLDWNTKVSQIPSDHQMVSVRFAPPGLPHIGKGRRTWPIGIMADEDLLKQIIKIGDESQRELHALRQRDDEANPQTIWKSFKNKITAMAKENNKDTSSENKSTNQNANERLTQDLQLERNRYL